MSYDFLIRNKYQNNAFNVSSLLKIDNDLIKIEDKSYWTFIIEHSNGGFFFEEALRLYTHELTDEFLEIKLVNECLNKEFNSLFKGLISFGEDTFGNQFCFETNSKTIIYFNVEDASKKFFANDFNHWIEVLQSDYDYYSGYSYLRQWKENYVFNSKGRLCPKIPFIIGGEFDIANFYVSLFPKYLEVNAAIAKQIVDLPDGTRIELKITSQ